MHSILELDAHLSKQMRVAEKPGALRAIAVFFAHSGDSWFWGDGTNAWMVQSVIRSGANGKSWSLWASACWRLWYESSNSSCEGSVLKVSGAGIYRNTDPHSFPSGHAARSFLIAVIATGLGPVWLAIILWIWAPLVALARVAMGVHYVSDMVAGAHCWYYIALIWFANITGPLFRLWLTRFGRLFHVVKSC